MVGVATTTTAAGVTAVVEVGKVQRVLVWLRAPPRWHFWSNNEGSGLSSGGGAARGERSTWIGSSTSFRSFSSSNSKTDDHSEVAVVADKRYQEPWQEAHLGLKLSLLFLWLLMTYFDGVDTEEGFNKLHTLECVRARRFLISVSEFSVLVSTATESERGCLRGHGCGVGSRSDSGE